MNKLVSIAVLGLALAACTTRTPTPAPRPSTPSEAPRPSERPPTTAKRILQSEAETLCLLQATKNDGVRLTDVKLVSTKKVDAGYLSKLMIGDVERTCIITPEGAVRSYR